MTLVGQGARYAIVGGLNTLVDLAVFALLVEAAGTAPVPANVVSFSTGAANSFLWNRHWTFRELDNGKRARRQMAEFAAVTLLGLAASTGCVALLAPVVGPLPAKLASVVVTFALTFAINRTVVFGGGPARRRAMED
ncbi:MAG: GtrA family protein [Azospirillaceae bacterium]